MDINQALKAGKIVKISFSECEYGLTFGDTCRVNEIFEALRNKKILRCTIDNVSIYLKSEEIENFVSLEEYEKIKEALDYVTYKYNDQQIKNLIKRRKRGVEIRGKFDCLNILKPETLELLYEERKKQESVNEIVVDLQEKDYIRAVTEEELLETSKQIDTLREIIDLRMKIDIALDKKDKAAFIDLTKKLNQLLNPV